MRSVATGTAGEVPATLGMLRQAGAIPPTAQSLDKQHSVHHTTAENINRSDLIGESCALSRDHFQIASHSALVTCRSKFQVFLSCNHSLILSLSFFLQYSQCGYIVFYLLKTSKYGLAIRSHRLIVGSDSLV